MDYNKAVVWLVGIVAAAIVAYSVLVPTVEPPTPTKDQLDCMQKIYKICEDGGGWSCDNRAHTACYAYKN